MKYEGFFEEDMKNGKKYKIYKKNLK